MVRLLLNDGGKRVRMVWGALTVLLGCIIAVALLFLADTVKVRRLELAA